MYAVGNFYDSDKDGTLNGRLLGKGDDSAAVIVYTPAGGSPREVETRLRAFVGDMWPSIDAALRNTHATAGGT